MSIEPTWRRIVSWLEANAPATAALVRPAASESALGQAQSRFSCAWPDQLTAWYRLQDGAPSSEMFQGVLPGFDPLPLDAAVSTAELLLGYAGDSTPNTASEAGGPDYEWRPDFVPIAEDGTGMTLYVDCRPGPLSGCVCTWDPEEGYVEECDWASVQAMLDDLIDGLSAMRPVLGWQPVLDGDRLTWEPVD